MRKERDQNTVQLTHLPTGPLLAGVIWRYRSRVSEREMCMWDGARPGLRARREGRDTGRGSLTERRARGGGCVMICCLWPGSLSYFRGGKTTDKILFNSIYCASFGNGGLAFLFLNDQNK